MPGRFNPHAKHVTNWTSQIPEDQWSLYSQVIELAQQREVPFAIGGAFAVATYTGFWRNTKDLDVYVLPQDREKMIGVLSDLGLADMYENHPYDRWWIYRGQREEAIVDVIWAMANHRAQIDQLWLSGPELEIRGHRVRSLPAEALLWDKLYIMQRDRCDWPDILNLLYSTGADVDWEYFLCRVGEDCRLLAGVLSVYGWVAPGRARQLPGWLWARLGLQPPDGEDSLPEIDDRRVGLLDSRAWFGPDRIRRPAA
jgi:hypothetical protein